MADLSDLQSAGSTKIVGSDATGLETNAVGADSGGNLQVVDKADGTPGSAAPSVAGQVAGTDGTNLRTIKTDTSGNLQAVGNVSSGSADSGAPIKTGGVYNSVLPTPSSGQRVDQQSDLNGRLIVAAVPLDGYRQTYSASVAGLVTAATATDVITISGSASKTIRITRISMTLTTTSGSGISLNISIVKRSTLDTGGTSTTLTDVPHDSTNAAGTAVVKAFTVNPTALGTAVGNIRNIRYAVAASNSINLIEWEFGTRASQSVVLRGVNDSLGINFNSTSVTGGALSLDIEWTEE